VKPIIIASTACLPGTQPLAVRIDEFRRQSIDAIELGAGVSVDGDLDAVLADTATRFYVHNYFPPPADAFVLNLASADSAVRARSLQLVTAALDLSARLGAPFYSVHGGFITDPIGFDGKGFVFPLPKSRAEADAAAERFIAAITEVLAYARERGVSVLVENNVCVPASAGKLLLQSAAEFEHLFRHVSDANLGVLLDTGHLNVSARTFDFDRLRFVDTVQDFVRAFHIHDNDGTADTHQPVTEDGWVMNVLHRAAFKGLPIIVESKFADAAALARHLQWLSAALAD
jgi:sugar phosphate isomerase/epimerase